METITLYAEYVEHLQRQGRNLNVMVLQNTVTGYGYGSLAEAEARLSGR